jgi:hypothetical protein
MTHVSERKHATMLLPPNTLDWRTASYFLYNLPWCETVVEHPVDVGEKVKVAGHAPNDDVSSVWREFHCKVWAFALWIVGNNEDNMHT